MVQPERLSLRPEQRIRKRAEFQIVFDRGKFARGRSVNIWTLEDAAFAAAGPRLGLIVSRKTHRRTVARNVWKRRIREIFRRNQRNLKENAAVLIQSRLAGPAPEYAVLEQELKALWQRNAVWKEP